jgi:hypothetical protein
MNDNTENQIKNIILDVLDDWSESAINLQSEAAREILADALSQPLTSYVSKKSLQLVEDVVCGGQ